MLLWGRHWNKDEMLPKASVPGATQPEAPSQGTGPDNTALQGVLCFHFPSQDLTPQKLGWFWLCLHTSAL